MIIEHLSLEKLEKRTRIEYISYFKALFIDNNYYLKQLF